MKGGESRQTSDLVLIAGLGNPGPEYRDTRHNIGFQVIRFLSRDLGVRLNGRRFQSRSCRTVVGGNEVILLCPWTFMNLSGQSIKACVDSYDIYPGNTLIIHDDLDLPLGKIKVVKQGGSGGHRGVQSIFDHLGNRDFPRGKIGISRPKYGETTEDYVLSPFYKSEKEIIDEVMGISLQVCKLFIQEGIVTTMNRINRNKQKLKEGLI
jgi:PTH1 family peptidyl-tRNA hydrolase